MLRYCLIELCFKIIRRKPVIYFDDQVNSRKGEKEILKSLKREKKFRALEHSSGGRWTWGGLSQGESSGKCLFCVTNDCEHWMSIVNYVPFNTIDCCILFVIINGLVNRQGPHPLDPAFGTARLSKDILKPFFSHNYCCFLCDSSNTIQRAFSVSFGWVSMPFQFRKNYFLCFSRAGGLSTQPHLQRMTEFYLESFQLGRDSCWNGRTEERRGWGRKIQCEPCC